MRAQRILSVLFFALFGLIIGSVIGTSPEATSINDLSTSLGMVIGGVIGYAAAYMPATAGILAMSLTADPAIRLKKLKEERQSLDEKIINCNNLITQLEARSDLSDEDKQKLQNQQNLYKELRSKIEALNDKIDRATEMAQIEARKAASEGKVIKPAGGEKREKGNIQKRYSFTKAIREAATGELTGLEKEMDQEARKSQTIQGNVGVPLMIMESEERDMSVTGDSGNKGGALVGTDKVGFIDILRNKLLVKQMGASVVTGLHGNISIPKKTAKTTASWVTENGDASSVDMTIGDVGSSPKRLAAISAFSKMLLAQGSPDVENLLREDLISAIHEAVDLAAINGSGSSNQPKGILNYAGIGSVVGGTNGAAPTWDDIVALETAIASANADVSKMGYLTNAKVRGKLKTTKIDDGSGIFVWQNGDTPLNGYAAGVSNQVPSTLNKGTSVGNCSAIIFGNWADLVINQWDGLDITVDPYTLAGQHKVRVVVNSLWDIILRNEESFAAMKDALTS